MSSRPRIPASVFTTGAPNDCGLIAAAASAYLQRHGVRSKKLYIRCGRDYAHVIVVFKSAGQLYTFDQDGTMRFTGDANWRTPPIQLAKAWVKAGNMRKRVLDAKFH